MPDENSTGTTATLVACWHHKNFVDRLKDMTAMIPTILLIVFSQLGYADPGALKLKCPKTLKVAVKVAALPKSWSGVPYSFDLPLTSSYVVLPDQGEPGLYCAYSGRKGAQSLYRAISHAIPKGTLCQASGPATGEFICSK